MNIRFSHRTTVLDTFKKKKKIYNKAHNAHIFKIPKVFYKSVAHIGKVFFTDKRGFFLLMY